MNNSEVSISTSGTVSFVGADAVSLYRARTLASGLRLYAKTKMSLTRTASPTAMLAMAGKITGKTYKRGAYEQAAADVSKWADTMLAALPVKREGDQNSPETTR